MTPSQPPATPLPLRAPRAEPSSLVFRDPVVTESGATVLPVCRVRGESAAPVGVYVLHGDQVTWRPAVDATRIARLGVLTGFVAAALGSLAVLRRPPWPDISIRISKRG